jgi:hypothetical protein
MKETRIKWTKLGPAGHPLALPRAAYNTRRPPHSSQPRAPDPYFFFIFFDFSEPIST